MFELQDTYNMAILFITHDLGVVAEIADEVAVMYLGGVVEQGSVDTIFNAPSHPYTQALLESIPKISSERATLNPIRGMVPSPFDRPTGCPFHPRCNYALRDMCDQITPAAIQVEAGHSVSCLLHDPAHRPQFAAQEITYD